MSGNNNMKRVDSNHQSGDDAEGTPQNLHQKEEVEQPPKLAAITLTVTLKHPSELQLRVFY